jgi:16S rRNA (cytosine1402-N4)-methyltransferase
MSYTHVTVMRAEALQYLDCRPGAVIVDGTLGGAGHAAEICARVGPQGLLIGIDQDPDAIENARNALKAYADRTRLFHTDFTRIGETLAGLGIRAADGILLDLGVSHHQFTESGRGFSFQRDEPLDMRMDPRTGQTAADMVNDLTEEALKRIFREYGEERWAGRIARRIAGERRREPIRTSGALARIVCAAVPGGGKGRSRIHPATRVFMALRIAVNRELERLEAFFDPLAELLEPGGRVCIIAFHSLEDRIVKRRLRALAGRGAADRAEAVWPVPPAEPARMRILTPKVVRPGAEEDAANPLARSARLRAAERI